MNIDVNFPYHIRMAKIEKWSEELVEEIRGEKRSLEGFGVTVLLEDKEHKLMSDGGEIARDAEELEEGAVRRRRKQAEEDAEEDRERQREARGDMEEDGEEKDHEQGGGEWTGSYVGKQWYQHKGKGKGRGQRGF